MLSMPCSILPEQCCDTLCTYVFMNDVIYGLAKICWDSTRTSDAWTPVIDAPVKYAGTLGQRWRPSHGDWRRYLGMLMSH